MLRRVIQSAYYTLLAVAVLGSGAGAGKVNIQDFRVL
jgi:hypothetical protein